MGRDWNGMCKGDGNGPTERSDTEEDPVLNVTPQARAALREMLLRALDDKPGSNGRSLGFRLVAGETEAGDANLGLALDSPRNGDVVVDHDGLSVLILDTLASELLDQMTLDLLETSDGTMLGLRE